VDLLVAASTLWCLFALMLFLPLVGAPAQFERAAEVLLALQFVALLAYNAAEAAYVLATRDLPLLSLALLATAVAHGVRTHRREMSLRARGRR
jgi:hypothetical protein